MSGAVSFAIGLVIPLGILLAIVFLSARAWRSNEATLSLSIDRITTPLIAGVSVLAIAIPLVATIGNAPVNGRPEWARGIWIAALLLALTALVVGAFVVYKVTLEHGPDASSIVEKDGIKYVPVEGHTLQITGGKGSETKWIPICISAHFSGLILFLICAFISVLGSQKWASTSESSIALQESPRVVVSKTLPILGSDRASILASWGTPTEMTATWLAYQSVRSVYVLCLSNDSLSRIIESQPGQPNAIAGSC